MKRENGISPEIAFFLYTYVFSTDEILSWSRIKWYSCWSIDRMTRTCIAQGDWLRQFLWVKLYRNSWYCIRKKNRKKKHTHTLERSTCKFPCERKIFIWFSMVFIDWFDRFERKIDDAFNKSSTSILEGVQSRFLLNLSLSVAPSVYKTLKGESPQKQIIPIESNFSSLWLKYIHVDAWV